MQLHPSGVPITDKGMVVPIIIRPLLPRNEMKSFRAVVALTLVVVVPLIHRLGIYDDSARRSKSGVDANTALHRTDGPPLPSLLYLY